jgi:hypothetical protein
MKRGAPVEDINEDDLVVTKPKKSAAGLEAVVVALERGVAQAGVTRTARAAQPARRHGLPRLCVAGVAGPPEDGGIL